MNSNNESKAFDPTLWFGGIIAVCLFVYTYKDEVLAFIGTVIGLLLGAVILSFFIIVPLRLLREKPRPPAPTLSKKTVSQPRKKKVVQPVIPTVTPEIIEQQRVREVRERQVQLQNELLESPLHICEELDKLNHYFLTHNGYEEKEFVPFGEVRRARYLIKKQKLTLEHTFVLYSLIQILDDLHLERHLSANNILSITVRDSTYAVCVVTPQDAGREYYLYSLAGQMSRMAPEWWFLTTSSAYKRSFTKYGDVLTRNDILLWVAKHLSSSPSPHITTPLHHTPPGKDIDNELLSRRHKPRKTTTKTKKLAVKHL